MRFAITRSKPRLDLPTVPLSPTQVPDSPQPPDLARADREVRFLRFPAVRARTGLSRSTIWRLERYGGFPRHRRISPNAVAWVEQEVIDWMRAKVEAGA